MTCPASATPSPARRDGAPIAPAGHLVEPGDAAALSTAISTLLKDPEARQRMGRAAVDRAATYSMDAIGARYVTLLRDAIGTGPARHEGEQR